MPDDRRRRHGWGKKDLEIRRTFQGRTVIGGLFLPAALLSAVMPALTGGKEREKNMQEELLWLCENYIANRDTIKTELRGHNRRIYSVCANIFCGRGQTARRIVLRDCQALLKEKVGLFSSFRGNLTAPVTCLLASGLFPVRHMDNAIRYYNRLAEDYYHSEQLALAAFLLPDMIPEEYLDELIDRSREIYAAMKRAHPFLTSTRDSVFALLLAFSPNRAKDAAAEMERCYRLLRHLYGSGSQTRTVAAILALQRGAPEDKAERLAAIVQALRMRKARYGKGLELAPLAAMADVSVPAQQVAGDILDVETYLSKRRGFRSMSRRERLMVAAMIVSDRVDPGRDAETSSLLAVIAMVAAEQAAAAASV